MGCPDWPKCFGYLIPPTEADQLVWKPQHQYQKGQMIILNDSLLVAQTDFVSTSEIDGQNWRRYDKHDYAIFNPTHTWIEYINRLFGALSGVPVVILFLMSLVNIRRDWISFVLSGLSLAALGYVAWLGKLVVDGHLIPHSITYHMFGALAVMLLIVAVIYQNRKTRWLEAVSTASMRILIAVVMLLSLVQVYLGTGVREQVDAFPADLERAQWINELGNLFLIHRSFSILVVLLNGWLIYLLLKAGWNPKWPVVLGGVFVIEIFAGVLLNYGGFPASMQPIHLMGALMIAAVQFYLLLQLWLQKKKVDPDLFAGRGIPTQ